ncbi:MAG: hypothetical protein GX896_09050 [Clostridiales bacterium]|nr:hypothetical protein [Clostridiales bacterium]
MQEPKPKPFKPVITKEDVQKASQIMQKYKEGKSSLEGRIIENEKWWRLRHWDIIKSESQNPTDPNPVSAWLHNSINNKHADFMDNYPTPNILPREESDKETAKVLSEIVPVILEINNFEEVYSRCCYQKLQYGTACYGAFWNNSKNKGLGDVEIAKIDLLNLFWEPGITDIQDSRNVFLVGLVDNDILSSQYPNELEGKLISGSTFDIGKYNFDDTVDTSEKSLVVDWYYKKLVDGVETLHLCKYVNDIPLFSSENQPDAYPKGFYAHGKYPFVFDVMFPQEGSPAGYGYIDVGKSPQIYIDKLNQIILKNALMSGRKRFMVKNTSAINEEEFTDWTKEIIHVNGNLSEDNVRELETKALPPIVYNVLQGKIDEIKETTANRDFSQGSTSGGVTAASAIAALQEAGNKLSRDTIKASYRAHSRLCGLVIELIREFYSEPRYFRICNSNDYNFKSFDNQTMQPQPQGEDFGIKMGMREPIFDIKINSQKSSPFNQLAQNENAKEMYNLGFFNPQTANQALIAIEMMDFEGKEMVISKIKEGQINLEQSGMYQEERG